MPSYRMSTSKWVKEAISHYNAKRYTACLKACERAIRLDPQCDRAYQGKGKALVGLECYEDGLAAYERAIELAPNNAKLYCDKGEALYRLRLDEAFLGINELDKLQEKAFAAYEKAVQLSPQNATEYYLARASFLNEVAKKGDSLYVPRGENKRYEVVLMDYEYVLQIDPTCIEAYIGKADALFKLGRDEEAILTYDRAIHLDPGCVVAHEKKGDALFLMSQTDAALSSLEQAICVDSSHLPAYETKAMVLDYTGRHEEAVAVYEQIAQMDPGNYNAYLQKGIICGLHLQRYEDACRAYDRAFQVNPISTAALSWKADLLVETQLRANGFRNK